MFKKIENIFSSEEDIILEKKYIKSQLVKFQMENYISTRALANVLELTLTDYLDFDKDNSVVGILNARSFLNRATIHFNLPKDNMKAKTVKDNRGEFSSYYVLSPLANYVVDEVMYHNVKKNVLKTFRKSNSQDKLIKVISGKAQIIVYNVETDSFKIYDDVTSSDDVIFVPIGTWYGYLSLEENTILSILCEGYYRDKEEICSPWSFMKGEWHWKTKTEYTIDDKESDSELKERRKKYRIRT